MNLASAAILPIKENKCPLVEKERMAGLDGRAGLGTPGFQHLDPLRSPEGNTVLRSLHLQSTWYSVLWDGVDSDETEGVLTLKEASFWEG